MFIIVSVVTSNKVIWKAEPSICRDGPPSLPPSHDSPPLVCTANYPPQLIRQQIGQAVPGGSCQALTLEARPVTKVKFSPSNDVPNKAAFEKN